MLLIDQDLRIAFETLDRLIAIHNFSFLLTIVDEEEAAHNGQDVCHDCPVQPEPQPAGGGQEREPGRGVDVLEEQYLIQIH